MEPNAMCEGKSLEAIVSLTCVHLIILGYEWIVQFQTDIMHSFLSLYLILHKYMVHYLSLSVRLTTSWHWVTFHDISWYHNLQRQNYVMTNHEMTLSDSYRHLITHKCKWDNFPGDTARMSLEWKFIHSPFGKIVINHLSHIL